MTKDNGKTEKLIFNLFYYSTTIINIYWKKNFLIFDCNIVNFLLIIRYWTWTLLNFFFFSFFVI